jgi:tRNA (guanine26-N2/guanine27-N2)-dimethyltransferase
VVSLTVKANIQSEGQVTFAVGNAFFQPQSRLSRDLGVLAARVYRQQTGHLRILDLMAGSGVRSLRYWQESEADELWVNDANPNLQPLLAQNLAPAIAQNRVQLTCQDAQRILWECNLQQNYYDFVDLDAFGSPATYLSTVLGAVKLGGLLYVTATDGRSLTGRATQACLRDYGCTVRSHPSAKEQALRILIGTLQQQAARIGRGIEPIFSLTQGQSFRVLVRLVPKPQLTLQNYGFLGYCHDCGDYQTRIGRSLNSSICPICQARSLVLSGFLWLGALHDAPYLQRTIAQAQVWNWQPVANFLSLMQGEIDFPPYSYPLAEIGRRAKVDIPPRSHLIQSLQQAGYRAVPSAIDAQAIKTDASLAQCLAIAAHGYSLGYSSES